ncbi:MAG TPA: UDP-N-acetylglucosamine 4,6-dehydratase (inverting), partial [Marinobacter hydrocarbonoclasticus]|nr:UDP-N-acetylglucosamine 4,6-dehydratase (inverting) [Marinobacter nauticus]
NINDWGTCKERIKDGKPVPEGFVYASDNNTEWMTDEELQSWIDRHNSEIGKI